MVIVNRFFAGIPLLLLLSLPALAQPGLLKMKDKLQSQKINTVQSFYKIEVNDKIPSQGSILFSADRALQKSNVQQWLSEQLQLRAGTDALQYVQPSILYNNFELEKLQQFYKGVKVEHGIINNAGGDGKVLMMQMEFYSISDSLTTIPSLTEDAALQKAMDFTGGMEFAWQHNGGSDPDWQKPKGELVIVEDIFNDIGKMCLAYKFNIYAIKPLSRAYIYVNAINGKVVFQDAIIKHATSTGSEKVNGIGKAKNELKNLPPNKAPGKTIVYPGANNTTANATGSAATIYSSTRTIVTDKTSPGSYRLHETGRGSNTAIQTFNINNNTDFTAVDDFIDDDNNWTAAEYADVLATNGAFDVHWGAEQVVDYWWTIHGRKSYDNADGIVKSYFHFDVNYNNAFWNGSAMFYGDGSGAPAGFKTFVSLDICGHELGHAVCQKTAGLVYQRESGALNEGFSDIWAACIDNFATPVIIPQLKQPWLFGEEIEARTGHTALRSLANPRLEGQPDTYKDTAHFWRDVSLEGCPVPDKTVNDFCGVHRNSGILNKWFYLLTMGGNATNGNNYNYNVTAMGFAKTEKLAYFTEQILTPNSGFEAAKIASINAASILGWNADLPNILEAWKAVGVFADTIYNSTNTPVFSTNQFTTIGVGQRGYVWAGTANNGLYRYDGKTWKKAPVLLDHNVADIKTDLNGGIWIAQFGRTGAQALNGGIDYFPDTSFNFTQFSTTEGLPTRNVRSLFINNALTTETYKRVWAATFADLTAGISRAGAVVRGLSSPVVAPNYFKKIVTGVDPGNGFCQTIGGNATEVWVFATSNFGHSQILRYRTADSAFIGYADETNSTLPAGFTAKAIFYDTVGKQWWVGMSSGGIYVYKNGWTQVNFPAIFPTGTIINNNAITGDAKGNIYIGTTNGYVFYGTVNANAVLKPDSVGLYKRYTTADGLPSDNVKAICVDTRASRVLLATDNGIVFKYNLCPSCINTGPIYSGIPGPWNSPGVWSSGEVPGSNSNVVVKHAVMVTQDATCNSLQVINPGSVTVAPGVKLSIQGQAIYMNGLKGTLKNK
ncbi:MAG: peptidase thermolysin [Ferruginibacter sp.]|nr:peptidase thermolysin [Ferruginibacter sp.]